MKAVLCANCKRYRCPAYVGLCRNCLREIRKDKRGIKKDKTLDR